MQLYRHTTCLLLQHFVEGIPRLNMPDVCTESPAHGKAFCDAHCEYLLSEAPGVPTGLKEFLKYCEVVTEGTYNNILMCLT